MKRKVWIINHYATTMFKNRGGRHYWFAKYLKLNGYEPIIICANAYHNSLDVEDTGKKRYVVKEVDNTQFVFVKTITATDNGIKRIVNMCLFYINLLLVYRSLIKAFNNPDVILASSVHPLSLVAGLKIARKLNISCICEVRDLWPEAIFSYKKRLEKSFLGRLMVIGEHWIYKRADALIFTKEGDVDYLKEKKWDSENGGTIDLKKVFYINNGLDLDEFNDCVVSENFSDNDLSSDCFKAVYVGAIRPLNDIEKLVNTAAILQDNKDVIFLIYGEGNQRDYLEKRVHDLKLTNILFKGEVNKEYIPYILSKSSVNILNYTQTHWNWARGNSSNKLFEYMASKKPIISTVKMGYSLIKRYDCGIEIEQATPEELANAILHVKNIPDDEYVRLCENAGRGALDFDFKILTEKLMNVIEYV